MYPYIMSPRRTCAKDLEIPPLSDEGLLPSVEHPQLQTGKRISILTRLNAGMKIRDVAKCEGVSTATVARIKNDPHLNALSDGKSIEKTKELLANKFYLASDQFLDEGLKPEKIGKLRSTEAMMAAGIAVDKARLLEGKSTENLSIRGVVSHLQAQLSDAELLRKSLLSAVEV